MCFSAPVSFTASGALAVVGTIILVRLKSKRYLPIALVPWFFAIQQAAEGIVWISMPNISFAKNIFLFFAYAFWPFYVPFAFWMFEEKPKRLQFLSFLTGIGLVISLYLLFKIPATNPICYEKSIQYIRKAPVTLFGASGVILYGIVTVVPFFVSSLKKIWLLGLAIGIAGILTFTIDHVYFVSVWCFFSAVLSLGLLFILYKK